MDFRRFLVVDNLRERLDLGLYPLCLVGTKYLLLSNIWFDGDIPLFQFPLSSGEILEVYFSEFKPVLFSELRNEDCNEDEIFHLVIKNLDYSNLIEDGLAINGRVCISVKHLLGKIQENSGINLKN